MSELVIKGKIAFIGDAEVISDKFSKRTFVLDVQDGNYEKKVAMQFSNDRMSKLDGLSIGQEVTVKFNLESREHNGKWYTNAMAWYLSKEGNVAPSAPVNYDANGGSETDSLPF